MNRYLNRYLLPSILYYLILFILFFLFIYKITPEINEKFLNWDAQHYYYIRENGYDITRCAFFPLFPFIWKWSALSPVDISILNGILFIFSISFLLYIYETSLFNTILIISIPSFLFFFYPYTESLFFSACTFFLFGLKKRADVIIYISLFMLSLIRPAISVIGPAILMVFIFENEKIQRKVVKIILSFSSIAMGLLLTFSLQKYFTGHWDAFFISQKKWGNELQIPSLPFRSWGGDIINRLDGVALFISIIALFVIVRKIRFFVLKQDKIGSNDLFISLLYVTGSGLLVLLYRNGELFSLNRFLFCSPFFIVLVIHFFKYYKEPLIKCILLWLLVLSIYWLLFASFVHIRAFLKYELLSIFLIVPFFLQYKKKIFQYLSFSIIMLVNSTLFLYFFYRILTNDWVG